MKLNLVEHKIERYDVCEIGLDKCFEKLIYHEFADGNLEAQIIIIYEFQSFFWRLSK